MVQLYPFEVLSCSKSDLLWRTFVSVVWSEQPKNMNTMKMRRFLATYGGNQSPWINIDNQFQKILALNRLISMTDPWEDSKVTAHVSVKISNTDWGCRCKIVPYQTVRTVSLEDVSHYSTTVSMLLIPPQSILQISLDKLEVKEKSRNEQKWKIYSWFQIWLIWNKCLDGYSSSSTIIDKEEPI